jgi:biopolymer transport protein ExbB
MKFAVLVLLFLSQSPLFAQDLSALQSSAEADLKSALEQLASLRQKIEAERLPIARNLTSLEQKVVDAKAELDRTQRFHENQLVELNALKTEAKRQSDEVKYIDSLVTEYTKAFRSRLNFAEEPRFAGLIEALEKAAAAPDTEPEKKLQERAKLLATALQRTESALGGEIIDGKALDKAGLVQSGKIALIGPVAIFADASGKAAGLLQQELNKPEPTIVAAEKTENEAGRELVTTGKGALVLDPTLGNAFKLSALNQSFYHKLKEGGPIMVPLIGCGLLAMIFGAFKWVQLARIRQVTEADLQTVLGHLENGAKRKALLHAQTIPGIAGNLLATAVEHAEEKKEYIEEILYEKMLGARARLERGIQFLALTATMGPLMGLLGTVMGMITTFKVISSAGSGDPKMLAAGISEALICTATGMAVAIPALLLHAVLSRKSKAVIGSMEQTSVGFINGVPDEQKAYSF